MARTASRSSARACCMIDSRPSRSVLRRSIACRHDLGHHMRALAAAEYEQAQLAISWRGIGRGGGRDHLRAQRIAGEGYFALPVSD